MKFLLFIGRRTKKIKKTNNCASQKRKEVPT